MISLHSKFIVKLFTSNGHGVMLTPWRNVFDIGIATQQDIDRLAKGERPELAGRFDISSNGNGSLMRISPLLFYLLDKPIS